jgi:hypothetical protein
VAISKSLRTPIYQEKEPMKFNLSVLVLATCSAVSAVTLLQTTSGKHSLTADGVPPPPWPKSLGTLVADGVPPPPWPKLGDALLVDGVPAPSWQPKGNGILDDSPIV